MRLAIAAMLLATNAIAAAPDDNAMAQHREKAEAWSAKGLSCEQVVANLRGWFGHLFAGEPNPRAGTCDIYVVTWEWRPETGRAELVHRARVATVPQ